MAHTHTHTLNTVLGAQSYVYIRMCVCDCANVTVLYCLYIRTYVRTYPCERLCEDLPPPLNHVIHLLQKIIKLLLLTALQYRTEEITPQRSQTHINTQCAKCHTINAYTRCHIAMCVCKQCIPRIAPSY